MRKLSIYNFLSLNGFYKNEQGDISWHTHGQEEGEYSAEMLQEDHILLFGRITYQMMESYWPTSFALSNDPIVANGMNEAEKIVFSTTLSHANWNNTTIVKDNIIDEIKKLKNTPGKNLTLLGSGQVLTQFAAHGLIDEYQLMIDPIAIGKGTPIFNGLEQQLALKLTDTKVFKSGTVLLTYQPL
ncbi:dihydrofolate reductase family protein [Pedobacter sp. Hv1]|uniref:dihydrofolate reductase family protein n=1 Tax=Pedobacter sp. Hv1 TaxID=1740090 RepID=UPI0006D8C0CA|nr:dihydrofolate reductase family protein [Pedobacter sp. Hv1]KQC00344.1 dihydrofolate reductase [Pedobacter sp. Hv1]